MGPHVQLLSLDPTPVELSWFAEPISITGDDMTFDADKHNMMISMIHDLLRQNSVLSMASNFLPHRAAGFEKIRLGSRFDGGYVMIDDFRDIKLALSFGIESNASWDLEIAERGVPVWQYDHTVDAGPVAHPLIRFNKLKIAAQPEDEARTVRQILAEGKVSKPGSVILKIDIENDEWDVFDACADTDLACFSQILVEFHSFSRAVDRNWLDRAKRVLEKLNKIFAVVHVHANNWTGLSNVSNVYLPETLEISFANRTRYDLEPSGEVFPTAIDQPNNPLLPDLYLGTFTFRAPVES
jgi:Methyltransferase FkbM domain